MNWLLDADPRPAILVLPPGAVSLDEAEAAIELWEFYKRRTLDPAQRLAVQLMMATNEDGLWAASTTGHEVSRQNGKGDEIEVPELWGLTQRAERILHTVHDAVLLATETQNRMLSLLEGHADLRRLIARVWRGTGQQMIEMRNGGAIWHRTRTGGGGRGVDEVDRIVADEAQHAELEHVAAVTPTQLASANPQLNNLGTGAIAGRSRYWWSVRKRALSPAPAGRFAYLGHTAEQISMGADGKLVRTPIDVEDRANWYKANPALVAGRVGIEFFEEQHRRLGDELFAREHLGVWDPADDEDDGERVGRLPLEVWASRFEEGASMPLGRVVLAVAVGLNGRSSSITAVGRRDDGRVFVEVQDCRPGTGWVADEVARFLGSTRVTVAKVAARSRGPVNELTPDLVRVTERAKVEFVRLSDVDYAGGCQSFVTAVAEDRIRHLGQVWLQTAIGGALERDVPGGLWCWDLSAEADATPLESATLAYRVLEQLPEPKRKARVHSF
jgi:hypothetical protein